MTSDLPGRASRADPCHETANARLLPAGDQGPLPGLFQRPWLARLCKAEVEFGLPGRECRVLAEKCQRRQRLWRASNRANLR